MIEKLISPGKSLIRPRRSRSLVIRRIASRRFPADAAEGASTARGNAVEETIFNNAQLRLFPQRHTGDLQELAGER